MKLYAKFPTQVRGQDVVAEMSGNMDRSGAFDIRVVFWKDEKPIDIPGLTREELGALCRQAAKVKGQ